MAYRSKFTLKNLSTKFFLPKTAVSAKFSGAKRLFLHITDTACRVPTLIQKISPRITTMRGEQLLIFNFIAKGSKTFGS